jgi:hypothetical protein
MQSSCLRLFAGVVDIVLVIYMEVRFLAPTHIQLKLYLLTFFPSFRFPPPGDVSLGTCPYLTVYYLRPTATCEHRETPWCIVSQQLFCD